MTRLHHLKTQLGAASGALAIATTLMVLGAPFKWCMVGRLI